MGTFALCIVSFLSCFTAIGFMKVIAKKICFIHHSWLPDIELPRDVATVDLSGVVCVTNRGTSMIHHKRRCYVCGQRKGLKMYCDKNDCSCNIDGQREKLVVHVTCARQAGLEVRVDDERMNNKGGPLPYGTFQLAL